jgi:xylulokinase
MALRWFRDEFGAGRDYAALAAEAAAVPAGADGLLMLPHLCGAGSPAMNPAARGVFCGVTLSHTRGHFVRAILEAVAFMLRENLDMLESLGAPVREVRCLGGAARSDLWLQIKADVCGRDLLVMECEEAACLGTAMVAFTGVGVHRSLAEAAECMVRPRRRVSPQAGGRYDRAFRRYQELYRLVTPFFGGAAS